MSVTKHLVYNTITHLNANVCTCSSNELSRAPVIYRLVASLSLARILLTCSRRTMYFTSLVLTILCLLLFSTFSYLLALTQAQGQEMFSLGVGSLLSSCLLVIRCAPSNIFMGSFNIFPCVQCAARGPDAASPPVRGALPC